LLDVEAMMRVLVTGGAGYIGSVAVERLLDAGHDVVVLDSLWRGHTGAIPEHVRTVVADLRDAKAIEAAVDESSAEAIMHFAAAAIVPESVSDPAHYFAVNVVGSHNLLVAARECGINRFVFSSTAAVYGLPTELPVREDAPKQPINPYGRSKLMVEEMLEWHASAYGLRYASLRYFNVAGATERCGEDHHPETHLIPVALQTVLGQREVFKVYGTDYPTPDGTAIRDYVHVVDLADAHLLALTKMDEAGGALGAFNIGTKEGFSVRQVVAAVEQVTGKPLAIEYGERRAGDPPALIADSTRARSELGWNPSRSTLEDMIGSAWAWMKAHPHGYERD
jgi:UDP-glucose 4-epimerase